MTGAHSHERENLYAGQGAVLLDIGGDVGALVVEMPRSMLGVEVEVLHVEDPHAADRHQPHVAVVDRRTPGATVPSLVFGELVAGTYELHEKGDTKVRLRARVRGGAVTEAIWPT